MIEQLIGLSLNNCVTAIVDGKITEEQINLIITGTGAPDKKEWDSMLVRYAGDEWEGKGVQHIVIADRLYNQRKIYQPRLEGKAPPNTRLGFWIPDIRIMEKTFDCTCDRTKKYELRLLNNNHGCGPEIMTIKRPPGRKWLNQIALLTWLRNELEYELGHTTGHEPNCPIETEAQKILNGFF